MKPKSKASHNACWTFSTNKKHYSQLQPITSLSDGSECFIWFRETHFPELIFRSLHTTWQAIKGADGSQKITKVVLKGRAARAERRHSLLASVFLGKPAGQILSGTGELLPHSWCNIKAEPGELAIIIYTLLWHFIIQQETVALKSKWNKTYCWGQQTNFKREYCNMKIQWGITMHFMMQFSWWCSAVKEVHSKYVDDKVILKEIQNASATL